MYNAGCTDKCMNTAGGFTCSCSLLGFTLAADNRTCIDMDECSLPAYNCTTTQTCVNTMGSYLCIDSLPSLFLVGSGKQDKSSIKESRTGTPCFNRHSVSSPFF